MISASAPVTLTRRHALLGLAALGLVAGCGTDGTAEDIGGGASPTTRSVTHPLGTTEVPSAASRIAVVDRRGTVCHLVSLGITPMAALTYKGIIGVDLPQVLDGRVDDVEVIPATDDLDHPNLEVLAGLEADLILGWSDGIADLYDRLGALAPTVGLEVDFEDASVSLRNVAEAVGASAQAEKIITEFETRLDGAAAEVGDAGTVSVLLGVGGNVFRVYEPGSVAICAWLKEFGATIGPTAEQLGSETTEYGFVEIGPENLDEIDADTIVLLFNTGADGDAAVTELEDSPLWSRLPAVAAERVVRLNSQAAVGQFGYPGFESLLDSFLEQWKALPAR